MEKNSILAGAYEALIAALYLDSGYKATFSIIEKNFLPIIDQVQSANDSLDYKSRLQEWVQEKHSAIPCYKVIDEKGPDHDKTFWVSVKVFGIEAQGRGKNKKAAEQDAARKALEILEEEF
jgi:dsRNA-specific ribonuclease